VRAPLRSDLVEYAGVTGQWAVSVARRVHRRCTGASPLIIEETWVGTDLALYLRYRVDTHKLGARFRLDVDPATGASPTDADHLASAVFSALPSEPQPDAFVDSLGYHWWSTAVPHSGWTAAVRSLRVVTIC
jgi:hypothetical protein